MYVYRKYVNMYVSWIFIITFHIGKSISMFEYYIKHSGEIICRISKPYGMECRSAIFRSGLYYLVKRFF